MSLRRLAQDQAVNIAESSQRVLRHPRVKPYVDLPRMSELTESMVRDSLNAGVRRDMELARSVLVLDDQVDNLRDQLFRELLTYMMGDSAVVFQAFELILVAKNIGARPITPRISPRTLFTWWKVTISATPQRIGVSSSSNPVSFLQRSLLLMADDASRRI